MMITNTKKIIQSFFLFLSFFFITHHVSASSAELGFSASSSVYVDNKIEITLLVKNLSDVDGGISAIGSKLSYDPTYLEYVSATSLAPFTVQYIDQSKKIAGLAMGNNITSNTSLIKLEFKAKKIGSTSISLSSSELSDSKGNLISCNNPSKSITINPPPSSNANLSSLTISNGSLNFNSATTNYNVSVSGDVTSIQISATTEDTKAKVSGTGSKSLNYGNNTFNIVVKAESGATKTYTITVNREDNRSSENTLKSLSVADYDLNPSFNSNTTTYKITVPFTVSSVNVSAAATDSLAKVSISGNNKLAVGKTTNITITVTAENGSKKTYTIKAKRENDPNKVLASDNFLANLQVNVGTISPEFQKDITEYTVNVSKEVEKIEITAEPSDKNFGEVEINGPEVLKGGENKFEVIVTAEDGSKKTYHLTVIKEKNPDEPNEPVEENTPPETIPSLNLKSLEITGGSLKEKFSQDKYLYHYKSKDKINIAATPEDEENSVTVLESAGIYTIIIENEEGETQVYTIIPDSSNILLISITIILLIIVFIIGYSLGAKKFIFSDLIKKFSKK